MMRVHMGLLELFQAGGAFMWPIALCSVIAMAIVAERLWTLQQRRVMPPDLTRRTFSLVESGQVNEKVIAALEANSPLGRILAAGLQHRRRAREVMMERLEDAGRHVAHDLERFLNTLGTIAGVAPLLGLLGTVTGIIKSFDAIYEAGLGDPRAFSGGIAEALLATAFGLLVAIPSLVAHRYLRGRVDGIVVQIEKDVVRFADALNDRLAGAARS
jgi:biopolymer transport protein ExbB